MALLKKILLLLICIAVYAVNAWSRDITFTPAVSLSEWYDTNVTFERTDEKEDFITQLKPSLYVDYKTELADLTTYMNSGLNYYEQETDLNYNTYNGRLDIDSDLMELFSVTLGGLIIKDTTLESELEETGRVRFREDRLRYDCYAGFGINLTELSMVNMGYRYRQVDYDSDNYVDYNLDIFSFDYEKKLKNQIDTIHFNLIYTLRESDYSESDNISVGASWVRNLSETLSFHTLGGYRWTQEYTDDKNKEESQGFIVDIGLDKQWDRTAVGLSYIHDLAYGAGGENLNLDRFKLELTRFLSERTKLNLGIRYYLTVGDIDQEKEDSQYYQIETKLTYNLTEWHRLILGYRYETEHDKVIEEDKDRDRNRVWAAITLSFPNKI
jgi:hypothetical protein